jgi:hypothetical protein
LAPAWLPMQQEAILKACGLKPGNRMEPPEQTGHLGLLRQQREDIQLVLQRALLVRMNAENQQENQHLTGLKIMLTISPEVAKDIQRCAFAGGEQALSGETCDQGILPISVQPRTMVNQIAAEADKEEYGKNSHSACPRTSGQDETKPSDLDSRPITTWGSWQASKPMIWC